MSITPNITAGIKAIKIAKTDALGNNQDLQLKEANVLRIKFDDLGVVEFIITDIAEYSTYYLYYVVPKQLGTLNSNLFLVTSLSGSGGGAAMVGGDINIYNSAVASGYLVFSAVTNRSSYVYNVGKFQTTPSSSYSTTINFSTKVWGTGSNGNSTNLFVGIYSTGSSGENLLAYQIVGLTNCSGSANAQPVSMSLNFAPPANSVWGIKIGSYFSGVDTWVSGSLTNIAFNSFVTSSTDIDGNETIPEPYTIYNVQTNDYNVIINNALEARFNDFYMDVDFSTNGIIAVNQDQILTDTATRAQVQYSDYTMARITNPRYTGCKTTSPGFNLLPVTGSPIGQISNVEQTIPYFIYTPGGRGNSLAERSGSGNYVIGFIVDENGDIYKPDSNTGSVYFTTINNSFTSGDPVILNNINNSGFINATQSYSIYKPLANSQTILHSDTGSLDQTYLVNGYYSAISMSLVNGVNTNIRVRSNTVNPTQFNLLSGTEVTASGFNSSLILNQANAFTASTGLYIQPQNFTPLRASITASVTYDVNDPGSGPPNTTNVTLRVYENNIQIASRSKSSSSGSFSQVLGVSSSIFISPGDTYYVTLASSLLDLDSYRFTNWEINPYTGSAGSGSIPLGSYYFTTGSNSTNVLTASADMSNFYGGNWEQKEILTNGTSSGFSSIQPFIINPLDEIRFEGNESQVALISSVRYNGQDSTLYLNLNRNIEPTEGINLDYFAIRRWIFSLDNMLINSPGTIIGPGLILPLYPTEKLKNNLGSIILQLQKDNLIT